jgi:hypothetical protein
MKAKTALLSCVLLALAVIAAPARAQKDGLHLDGTLVGTYDPLATPPAWSGFAYLSIGNGPVQIYRFVDVNTGGREHPSHFTAKGSGNYNGYEQLTVTTLDEASSFVLNARFVAVCSTPYYCALNETADLVPGAGTGEFAGVKGTVAIHGPFAGGDCVNQPCMFIGQLSGSMSTR